MAVGTIGVLNHSTTETEGARNEKTKISTKPNNFGTKFLLSFQLRKCILTLDF